jgi:SOS-response transcriptional repressor LexA
MARSKDGLTAYERDQQILQLLADDGVGTSIRDLVKRLGCAIDTVQRAITRLESGQLVEARPRSGNRSKANSIRLTELGRARAAALAGPPLTSTRIAAGAPVHVQEDEGSLRSLGEIIGRNAGDRVVRVTGSSMADAAVHDRDYLVVYWCPADTVNDGEMVVTGVVQTDISDATVKFWERTTSAVRLHPANAGGFDWKGDLYQVQEYPPEEVTGAWRIRWVICGHPPRVRLPSSDTVTVVRRHPG